MNIEYWRSEIDEIDRELLRLLNRRARLAMKVGALKSEAGLPCCDPERERLVLGRVQQANPGPLDHGAVAKVFRRIIRESRRVEMLSSELPAHGANGDAAGTQTERRSSNAQTITTARSHELSSGEGVLV
jgi:chorismate mutase